MAKGQSGKQKDGKKKPSKDDERKEAGETRKESQKGQSWYSNRINTVLCCTTGVIQPV